MGTPPVGHPHSPSSAGKVLVIDDDANVRDVLRRYLSRAGHQVIEAEDGLTGLELARTAGPDLLILDLMLPGLDGLDVCSAIRRESDVGVIMLTALGSEDDRIVGLEHGADDYVVKPFSPREVTLRAQRILERRSTAGPMPTGAFPTEPVLTDGDLELNPAARTATRRGVALSLTSREFDLLEFFLRHPDQAFTRTELMSEVWHWTFGDESTVTVHARRLREKIEDDPTDPVRLLTVWGHGYRYRSLITSPPTAQART